MFRKAPKYPPESIVVSLEGFSCAAGAIPQGRRVRASHPLVATHPEMFAPDVPDDELDALIRQRRADQIAPAK